MWSRSVSPVLSKWHLGRVVALAVVAVAVQASPTVAQRPLGIDVSAWQLDIPQDNWHSIYNEGGKRFALIRVTHWGASNGNPDSEYVDNMARARAAGLIVGPYHYAIWSRTPQVEADFFLQYATPYIGPGYLPPMLDLEATGNPPADQTAGATSVCDWARQWMARVKEVTGVDGGIYTSGGHINTYCTAPGCSLVAHPLWDADWCGENVCDACGDITNPAVQPQYGIPLWGNGNWKFWQYCSTGSVAGIGGRVDLDVFNGTLAQLQEFVIGYPKITSVQAVSITQTGATITWTTAVPASSQVQYGLTAAYGSTSPLDNQLKTFRSVTLTGLTPGTLYHYQVISTAYDLVATSVDYTFTTATPAQIQIDNTDSTCVKTGSWTTATAGTYKIGTNYLTANPTSGAANATCRWTPNIPSACTYDVYVYYQLGSNRNTAAPYTIVYNGGALNTTQNQYSATSSGGWFKLNATPLSFAAGAGGYVQVANNSAQAGLISADAARFVRIDTQAPTVPASLSATTVSTSSIQLSWSGATDNTGVVGYRIYRNGAPVGTINTLSYLETGLTANTTYSFQVAAYDAVPNESALSNPAVNRCTLSTPPDAGSVTPNKTTGCARATVVWTAVGGFGSGTVHHYRYAWNQNPTYSFTGSEPQWSTGTLSTVMSSVGTWYLHVQGRNADNIANGTCDYSVEATASVMGDFNGNCRVDAPDVAVFRNCLGAAGVAPSAGCGDKDLDSDNDVDQDDFGILQQSFTSN